MKSAMKKLNQFLKKSKVISNVAFAVDSLGYPVAKQVGSVAKNLGYGRKKAIKGRGMSRAGGALRRAGRGRGSKRGTKKTSFP